MKRFFFASALAVLAACSAPLPQSPPAGVSAQVPAPQVRPGDEWTYRVRDGFTGLPRPEERHRVTEVSGNRIVVAVSRANANDEIQVFDAQWNWVKHPATNLQMFEYSPAYRAFAFPLTAGSTWHARATATDPATGQRFPVVIQGTVLGWERVKVPAGEFDALKVKRVVFLNYYEPNVRERSEIIETEWYVPAVKQAVKRDTTGRYVSHLAGARPGLMRVRGRSDGGGPRFVQDDWLIYELVSHRAR